MVQVYFLLSNTVDAIYSEPGTLAVVNQIIKNRIFYK